MAVTNIYVGCDMADKAVLTSDAGVTFHCVTYRSVATQRIEAKIFAENEGGGVSMVHHEIVATSTFGDLVDAPRVLAVGSLFVLHWIDTDLDLLGIPVSSLLFRATIDVDSLTTGWTNQGSVSLHTSNLYDHSIVYNSSPEEFVVSRRTAAGDITTARYRAPFSWVDTVWLQIDAGLTIADTVLACYADEDDNAVMVCWQDTLTLQNLRRNASDGLGLIGPLEVFNDLGPTGDNVFTAVTITCPAGGSFIVFAEFIDDTNESAGGYRGRARGVGWREVRPSLAVPLHESQWAYGVQLASKAFRCPDAFGGYDAYVALGFLSLADGQEYEQSYTYVMRARWTELADANAAGVIRPEICSAMMDGSMDARPHGFSPTVSPLTSPIGQRLNHLPHVNGPGRSSPAANPGYTLGPNIKAMSWAALRYTRLVLTVDDLQPLQAGIDIVRFFWEDPWIVRRGDLEAAQPDEPNWRGYTTRSMSKALQLPTGLLLTGGVTMCYDGQQPVELGYFHAPEILEIATNGGGGSLGAGTYQYYLTYLWTDMLGQQHRSPPSRPFSVTTIAGDSVNVIFRPLAISAKDDLRRYPFAAEVAVELWRTTVNGGIFYRVYGDPNGAFAIQDTPLSDNSDIRQIVVEGQADLIVVNNETAFFQLDTATLQYVPPPPRPHQPLTVATLWRNRVIGVDPSRPKELVYSEELLPLGTQTAWPEFLDTNTVRFDRGADVTAIQSMDYITAVWTENSIHTLEGEPAAGGAGATLDIRDVVTGIGCRGQESVVHTHLGCFFQAAKGIYLLTRGFDVQHVGEPLELDVVDAGNIRGAFHLQDIEQVQWVANAPLENGIPQPRRFTFDYSTGLWSVDTFPPFATSPSSRLNEMQDIIGWYGRQGGQQVVWIQQGGIAVERSAEDTVYSDEGVLGDVAVGFDVQSTWIKMDEVAGLYRVREIGLQTIRNQPGDFTVDVYYDTDGTYDETTVGDTFTWDSPAPAYLTIKPRIQRLSAFMVRIRERTPEPSESVRIVSMMVRWMPRPTPRRVGAATIGT